MTGKEYLQTTYSILAKIADIKMDIKDLEEVASMCGSSLTGMPSTHSADKSRVEALVCKIAEKKQELQKKEESLKERQAVIALCVSELKGADYKRIITLRYIKGKEWETIKTEMGLSDSYVFSLHHRAAAAFSRVFEKNNFGK